MGPLTFGALSRHAVETDVLDLLPDGRIGHIVIADAPTPSSSPRRPPTGWARWPTASPPTSVTADLPRDVRAPVVVAPAMDGDMYAHPRHAGQRRTAARRLRLRDRGARERAARHRPGGHRPARRPAAIVDAVVAAVGGRPVRPPDPAARPPLAAARSGTPDLDGRHVVVTAGGTAEPIDPVRFIGNRSTGKMGVAVAEAALDRGARVTLVAGRVRFPSPARSPWSAPRRQPPCADAVLDAVIDQRLDALVMAAAVADFRPVRCRGPKLARGGR